MPLATVLPDDLRELAAALIATQLYRVTGVLFPDQPTLSGTAGIKESFLLHTATIRDLVDAAAAGESLASACHDTGTWHHQIAAGEKAVGFASTDAAQTSLLSIMNGTLAPRLESAIRLADSRFDDSYSVKMVCVTDVRSYVFVLTSPKDDG